MANPRKFSEKIALHAQKQAEETAAFEQIMREVNIAVPPKGPAGVRPPPSQPVYISGPSGQPAAGGGAHQRGGGGSLPNASQMAAAAGYPGMGGAGPPYHHHQHHLPYQDRLHQEQLRLAQVGCQPIPYSGDRRGSGVGPHRSPRASEHRRDTSPYRAGGYLSPPADSSWRRTHSDSALHQGRPPGDGSGGPPPSYSPVPPPPAAPDGSGSDGAMSRLHGPRPSLGSSPLPAGGHWSSAAPPGQRGGGGQPLGSDSYLAAGGQRTPAATLPPSMNSSGSLPDLSALSFPASPAPGASRDQPAAPTFCQSLGGVSPVHSPLGERLFPGVPPPQRHPQHIPPPLSPAQSSLGVPGSVSSNYLHTCKDSRAEPMGAYRTPQLSPRSVSPLPYYQAGYRSPSPLDSVPSAPSSPAGPPSPVPNLPNGGFFVSPQTQQMQKQFEQFSMEMSAPAAVSSCSSQSSAMTAGGAPLQTAPTSTSQTIPEITLSGGCADRPHCGRGSRVVHTVVGVVG
ncbi:CREB-regulated transcription coactivator 1 [Amphibalanus amphitrite]|uniref:CREB-regulated transcription coactivator 1 n=1 Tax=Amphibalanus amphitrite TaxID=1232801 RepID=A0A6A4V243_AMPAM|nr:CREB-regulated transcription coactivator 1 [Amphibalanus amphitrite]